MGERLWMLNEGECPERHREHCLRQTFQINRWRRLNGGQILFILLSLPKEAAFTCCLKKKKNKLYLLITTG